MGWKIHRRDITPGRNRARSLGNLGRGVEAAAVRYTDLGGEAMVPKHFEQDYTSTRAQLFLQLSPTQKSAL